MLGRPHRVAPLMESIEATVPDARVLFALSPGDDAVHREVDRTARERIIVPYQVRGDYARKINHGYRLTDQALIFTGADDLYFNTGWFEAAVTQLGPGIGVVGTNDLGSPRVMAGDHATHFLVTREYADLGTVDQPNAIFCEEYPHEFVDDELAATAKSRSAWAMALDSKVAHKHPNWDPSVPMDGLYLAQQQRMRAGRPIFQRRQRLWA